MHNEFDLAIADLDVTPTFNENNFAKFALQREDNSEIIFTLFKDVEQYALRMTAHTSNTIPPLISTDFFSRFAEAALEPLRGGIGVGKNQGDEYMCVYYTLSLKNYIQGQSLIALKSLVEQVDEWDAVLTRLT